MPEKVCKSIDELKEEVVERLNTKHSNLKEFREDCKKYKKAIKRAERFGIHEEYKVIAFLEEEIDYYRSLADKMKNNMAIDKNVSIEQTEEIALFDIMPHDMRDRIYSIEIDNERNVSIYFESYYEDEGEDE